MRYDEPHVVAHQVSNSSQCRILIWNGQNNRSSNTYLTTHISTASFSSLSGHD